MTYDLNSDQQDRLLDWVGQQEVVQRDDSWPGKPIKDVYGHQAVDDIVGAVVDAMRDPDLCPPQELSTVVNQLAARQSPLDKLRIRCAQEHKTVEGELEVDDTTVCSGSGDEGDYVMGWIWISDETLGLEEGEAGYVEEIPRVKLDTPLPSYLKYPTLRHLLVAAIDLSSPVAGHHWSALFTKALIELGLAPGTIEDDESHTLLRAPSDGLENYVKEQLLAYMKEPATSGHNPATDETVSD